MKITAGKRSKSGFFNALAARIGADFRWNHLEMERETVPGLLESLEAARREWKYANLYFNCVTDPDLIDHAIFYMGATEKKYIYLLKRAREEGLNIDAYHL